MNEAKCPKCGGVIVGLVTAVYVETRTLVGWDDDKRFEPNGPEWGREIDRELDHECEEDTTFMCSDCGEEFDEKTARELAIKAQRKTGKE
jgi:predicted RNA-binding Zn-ribbon protein involved in translation (DUF1610 family)